MGVGVGGGGGVDGLGGWEVGGLRLGVRVGMGVGVGVGVVGRGWGCVERRGLIGLG